MGDQSLNPILRLCCLKQMIDNRIMFETWINSSVDHEFPYDRSVFELVNIREWANQHTMMACVLAVDRPIYVYRSFVKPISEYTLSFVDTMNISNEIVLNQMFVDNVIGIKQHIRIDSHDYHNDKSAIRMFYDAYHYSAILQHSTHTELLFKPAIRAAININNGSFVNVQVDHINEQECIEIR